MPLKPGYSPSIIAENIRREMRRGRSQKQAIAIALEEARRHWRKKFPRKSLPEHLQPRKNNPDVLSIKKAKKLYEDFSGHEPEILGKVRLPPRPKVGVVIGEIDGILYSTVRDGKSERYIHRFRKNSRPLFVVSDDGKQLYMLGGAYRFTERGIVDL